jgi:hypothetical protein
MPVALPVVGGTSNWMMASAGRSVTSFHCVARSRRSVPASCRLVADAPPTPAGSLEDHPRSKLLCRTQFRIADQPRSRNMNDGADTVGGPM